MSLKKTNQKKLQKFMGNLLLLGFERPFFDAFCELNARPKVWVKKGRKLGAVNMDGTLVYEYSPLKYSQVKPVFAKNLDSKIARKVRDLAMPIYLRNINRIERSSKERARTWTDYNDRLEIMINWYFELLKTHKIETIVFDNTPHGGSNIALYYLAKELNILTIVPYQTLFGSNFMLMEDYDDVGLYKTAKKGPKNTSIKINKEPVHPFYYRNLPRKRQILWQLTDAYLDLLWRMISRRTLDPNVLRPKRRRIDIIKEKLSFITTLNRAETDFDKNKKYFYYPLHFQPEMNVDVFGGIYSDQILLIEELRRKIPDDVYIYVKENPHQSEYARGENFFRRLASIPNVVYLHPNISSFDLISGSIGVVTLAGTAGWEAVQMGKPVLCFGCAWYRPLPGVFVWDDEFNWKEFLNYKCDYALLQKEVTNLTQYFDVGICNVKGYSSQIENFDAQANAKQVVHSMIEYAAYRKK